MKCETSYLDCTLRFIDYLNIIQASQSYTRRFVHVLKNEEIYPTHVKINALEDTVLY